MNTATIDTAELDDKIAKLTSAVTEQDAVVADLRGQAKTARDAHSVALAAVDLAAAQQHLSDAGDLEQQAQFEQATVDTYRVALNDLTERRQIAGYQERVIELDAKIQDGLRVAHDRMAEVRTALTPLRGKLSEAAGAEEAARVTYALERNDIQRALGQIESKRNAPIGSLGGVDPNSTLNIPMARTALVVLAEIEHSPLLTALAKGTAL